MDDELDDLGDVGTGFGNSPEEFDGIAISVSLTTATYDRDGEPIQEADLELDEVVSVTPPTATLYGEDGDRLCSVPVYVTAQEMHVD